MRRHQQRRSPETSSCQVRKANFVGALAAVAREAAKAARTKHNAEAASSDPNAPAKARGKPKVS